MKARAPDLPGVYKFTNKTNGKVYIGKAVNLRIRLNNHWSREESGYFYRAKKKYGLDNFQFSVIEVYPVRTPFIEELILKREAFWIKIYDATDRNKGYNICKEGTNTAGRAISEKTKIAVALANKKRVWTPEARKKLSEKGKKENLSEETRYKMGSSIRGKKVSKETIAKRAVKTKGQKRPTMRVPILQICPKTLTIIKEWDSSTQAAIELYGDISKRGHIGLSLRGLAKKALGFIWKRKRDYV